MKNRFHIARFIDFCLENHVVDMEYVFWTSRHIVHRWERPRYIYPEKTGTTDSLKKKKKNRPYQN